MTERKPLRIAIWHNLPSGGGKRQLYTHVQGLLERGHYLESWCPDTADQKYLPLGKLIKEHVIPLPTRSAEFHTPVRPRWTTQKLLASMEAHCRTCAEAINDGGFDLLYAGACLFLRTTPIASFVNLPSSIYLGEPYRWFYEAMPEIPWLAPAAQAGRGFSMQALRDRALERSRLDSIRIQARAELEYLKRFDQVLVNSIFSRETILRTYNLESRVCLLGIDSNYYKPTGEPREKFVVGLGTLYRGKGVDRAIRAVGAIPADRRPPLIWIGNGAWEDELQEYRKLAQHLGVEFVPKVHIPDTEVVSLLSRATVMLFTSRLEPFGLAPLEANACGTPVVGIAEGGIKESIVDGVNGFLAPDDDPVRIAELISRFIDDPELASRMGAQARAHVREKWSMAGGTDAVETALIRLWSGNQAKALLSNKPRLLTLEAAGNVRCHIEEKSHKNGTLRIKGWAHISDGRHATGAEVFILARTATDVELVRAVMSKRPDVTAHFADGCDYDDSGFVAEGELRIPGPHVLGVVIVRGDTTAVHFV